jgi:nicotinate-nucleotide adenylyltransferase
MSRPSSDRIGILGGTFDPVHLGHLIIAEELRFRLRLETVLFLLAGRPPHKTDVDISPDVDRLVMLSQAIVGNPHFELSLIDLNRVGLSYTADSLASIQRDKPGAELFFLMGEDSLRDLPTWHDPNRIARRRCSPWPGDRA